MSSSNHSQHHKGLAQEILKEFNVISTEFSSFQESSKLHCIEGCGKCCFKPDIYCSPIELLPMALELLAKGEAEDFHERCAGKELKRCIFLNVTDEEKFQASCTHYAFRPLVCRTFGVSARHGKNERVDFSICKPIKEERRSAYDALISKIFSQDDGHLPFIDRCKNHLITLDPLFLEQERPINESLKIMLEKVLFYADLNENG